MVKVELTVRVQTQAGVKNQRRIFHEDSLSPLLFVIAKMPLN